MRVARVISALILFSALWMPLSSCTTYVNEEGQRVEIAEGQPIPQGVREMPIGTVRVWGGEWNLFSLDDPVLWFVVVGFTWPAIFTIYFELPGTRGRVRLMGVSELLLAGVSVASLYILCFGYGDRIRTGGVLAFAALFVFLAIEFQESVSRRNQEERPVGA